MSCNITMLDIIGSEDPFRDKNFKPCGKKGARQLINQGAFMNLTPFTITLPRPIAAPADTPAPVRIPPPKKTLD
jgi:hypothetical protein